MIFDNNIATCRMLTFWRHPDWPIVCSPLPQVIDDTAAMTHRPTMDAYICRVHGTCSLSHHATLRCTMHYVVLLFTWSLVAIFYARLVFWLAFRFVPLSLYSWKTHLIVGLILWIKWIIFDCSNHGNSIRNGNGNKNIPLWKRFPSRPDISALSHRAFVSWMMVLWLMLLRNE
jgi:hypothetical protein